MLLTLNSVACCHSLTRLTICCMLSKNQTSECSVVQHIFWAWCWVVMIKWWNSVSWYTSMKLNHARHWNNWQTWCKNYILLHVRYFFWYLDKHIPTIFKHDTRYSMQGWTVNCFHNYLNAVLHKKQPISLKYWFLQNINSMSSVVSFMEALVNEDRLSWDVLALPTWWRWGS